MNLLAIERSRRFGIDLVGPGNDVFGDFGRIGVPFTVIVLAVSVVRCRAAAAGLAGRGAMR